MFDRDVEWMALAAFAGDPRPGATLGVVSGRRRQGKTFLLRALCEATGGFYFAADEATDGESLHQLGAALGAHLKLSAGLHLRDWHEAMDALLGLGIERPIPVVIDEFPYLAKANPALPSILQNAIAPRRPEREGSRSRLLLCGSAMTFMGTLLSGSAPLRGRAGLELVVPTLNYQLAAEFWGITDPTLAVKVHAVVGGTPAYRREFARDDTPADAGDFDSWVQRTVLNPASPLFREARYLLAAEAELHDMGLYHSVLAAIADGSTTRGNIAKYIGRKSGDLAHPLNVLMDCGLVLRRSDAFRENQTTYEIAEPLVTFYHAVMRPIWSDLAHTRNPARLWERSQPRFTANVLGSHFEQLARHWTRYFAPEEIVGGFPSLVEPGTVNDPGVKKTRQVDVVALGPLKDREALLAIGEVKWHETMGLGHLDRLRHIRGLLTAQRRHGAATARLLCFSGAGFSAELSNEAARAGDVRLLTPADLYSFGIPAEQEAFARSRDRRAEYLDRLAES
jgi:AAA+ ATPase superfamily predicted ATPase